MEVKLVIYLLFLATSLLSVLYISEYYANAYVIYSF